MPTIITPSAGGFVSDTILSDAVRVSAKLVAAVHGQGESEFATLLVMEFRFQPVRRNRRFKSAIVSLQFSGAQVAIKDLAPSGKLSLNVGWLISRPILSVPLQLTALRHASPFLLLQQLQHRKMPVRRH